MTAGCGKSTDCLTMYHSDLNGIVGVEIDLIGKTVGKVGFKGIYRVVFNDLGIDFIPKAHFIRLGNILSKEIGGIGNDVEVKANCQYNDAPDYGKQFSGS